MTIECYGVSRDKITSRIRCHFKTNVCAAWLQWHVPPIRGLATGGPKQREACVTAERALTRRGTLPTLVIAITPCTKNICVCKISLQVWMAKHEQRLALLIFHTRRPLKFRFEVSMWEMQRLRLGGAPNSVIVPFSSCVRAVWLSCWIRLQIWMGGIPSPHPISCFLFCGIWGMAWSCDIDLKSKWSQCVTTREVRQNKRREIEVTSKWNHNEIELTNKCEMTWQWHRNKRRVISKRKETEMQPTTSKWNKNYRWTELESTRHTWSDAGVTDGPAP